MDTTTVTGKPRLTMRQLQMKERTVFSAIPGMNELLHARGDKADRLRAKYPDAAFALMAAENLFTGDREQNMIHQKAYFAILDGESIPNARFRYDWEMDVYVEQHMWD